jgi:hypothetical protein
VLRASTFSLMFLVAGRAALAGKPFSVTMLTSSGALIKSFDVTLPDQHAFQVKIGPDGNIWIPRSDNSHGFGTPNPNDVIAVYDLNGNLLRTISGGGMRDPTSVSWDSAGNIYVTGSDDHFAANLYKYDQTATSCSASAPRGGT